MPKCQGHAKSAQQQLEGVKGAFLMSRKSDRMPLLPLEVWQPGFLVHGLELYLMDEAQ